MSVKQVKKGFLISNIVVVALVLIILLFNSVYVVQEQEQAVVVTLGRASVVTTPGPHFKVPFLQDVTIVPMVINSFTVGYDADNRDTSVLAESLMITSDYNFVNVDFFVEYQVADPERYLFASNDPELIVRNLALSYIRDTIGLHEVDEVITTGKNEIQAEIKEKLINRLAQENIGLQLVNITIQDAEPPTDEVKDAFKNVETAKQGKDTAINTALKYESEEVPAARASEDAILKEAEAQREARINEGRAQVAVFNAMYDEYRLNPEMTRLRMYYETMEEVLPGLKVVIDSGDGAIAKVLPLDPLGIGSATTGSTTNRSTEEG